MKSNEMQPEMEKSTYSNQLKGYELEKFGTLRTKLGSLITHMSTIEVSLKEADELGIIISGKNHGYFTDFYNSHMKGTDESDPIDFLNFSNELREYSFSVQQQIIDAKAKKEADLKDSL